VLKGAFASRVKGRFYPSQTKIWDGGTKDEMRLLRGTFQGRDYSIGQLTIENSVDNPHFIFCFSFQIYAPQTKILEGLTKDDIRIFR
jgi:hypothetical protein